MTFRNLFRHVLMNEEGAATAGAGGAPAATTQAPADATLAAINAPQTVGDVQDAAKQVDQPAPKAEEAAKPAAAPEAYTDFTLPEGVELQGEMLTDFQGLAKELNLTQDQAQKLVDLQTKYAKGDDSARQEALTKQSEAWVNQIKNDPVLGGAKFDSTVATAVKAMNQFGTPELRSLLNQSALGNHPDMIRLFHSIGTAISEDRIVTTGSEQSDQQPQRAADVMFGSVFKQ